MKTARICSLLLTAVLLCSLLTACNSTPQKVPSDDESANSSPQTESSSQNDSLTEEAKSLILECFKNEDPETPIYFASDYNGTAQIGDQRIDAANYVGETATGQTTGVGFKVDLSSYYAWDGENSPPCWRQGDNGILVVLGKDSSGQYTEYRGISYYTWSDNLDKSIIETTYHIYDLDVALWMDGLESPIGLGCDISPFAESQNDSPQVNRLDSWEPIYYPGDYWSEMIWPNFKAVCYNSATGCSIQTLGVTRSDLYTSQGIHVGSTRAEVIKVYPNLSGADCPYEGGPDFPSSDYLWYCEDSYGYGPGLFFFFDNDTVCEIFMLNFVD